MRPPLLHLPNPAGNGAGVVFSGFVLAPGVWAPRVIAPILRGRREDGALLYGTAGREWTLWPPSGPETETGAAVWEARRQEYSPHTGSAGGLRQVATPTITTGATTVHRCVCGADGPWVMEWVVGAVHHTARLECRACWTPEERHPEWVVELVRRLQPRELVDGQDVDLEEG